MSKEVSKIDSRMLLQNLKDLDYVSRKVAHEMETKNNILKLALQDSKRYRMQLDNASKN